MKLLKSKRGNLLDILWVGIFLFAFALTVVIGWLVLTSVNDAFQANDQIGIEGQQIINDSTNRYVAVFDGIFMFFLVAVSIMVIVSAFWIKTHPIFFGVSLVVLVIFVFLFNIFGDVFMEVGSNPALVNYTNSFSIIPFVMDNYATLLAVLGFVAVVVLFAKASGGWQL